MRGVAGKRNLLDKMLSRYGSKSAGMDALLDGHYGSAAIIRHVLNRLYLDEEAAGLKQSLAVSFNWDAASYSRLFNQYLCRHGCLQPCAVPSQASGRQGTTGAY